MIVWESLQDNWNQCSELNDGRILVGISSFGGIFGIFEEFLNILAILKFMLAKKKSIAIFGEISTVTLSDWVNLWGKKTEICKKVDKMLIRDWEIVEKITWKLTEFWVISVEMLKKKFLSSQLPADFWKGWSTNPRFS